MNLGCFSTRCRIKLLGGVFGVPALLCLTFAGGAWADEVNVRPWEAEEYAMAVDDSVPNTPWGVGYARTPPSVLMISGNDIRDWGGYNRKIHEVARALGGVTEYVRINRFTADNERAMRLLASRDWDVIALWTSPEGHNPAQAAYVRADDRVKAAILAAAAEKGTGLLFIMPSPPAAVFTDERREPLPEVDWLGGLALTGRQPRTSEAYRGRLRREGVDGEAAFRQRYAEAYRLGAGRLLALRRLHLGNMMQKEDDAVRFDWEHRIDVDYLNAEVVRAIWMAADRAPEVAFLAMPPALWQLPWTNDEPAVATWRLEVRGEPRDLVFNHRIRDLAGRVQHTGETRLPHAHGETIHTLTLPTLDAGRYYLDVFVDGPHGRENFGYGAIDVAAPLTVYLELETRGIEPGEPIAGTVVVALPADGAPVDDASLRLALLDSHDRVLEIQEHPAPFDAPRPFQLSTDVHDTMQMRVRAEAFVQERVAARAHRIVNQRQRRQDRFNFVTWGNIDGLYGHYTRRRLWRAGVTAMIFGGGHAADANLAQIPMIGSNNWRGEIDGQPFDSVWYAVRPLGGKTAESMPAVPQPGELPPEAEADADGDEPFALLGEKTPVAKPTAIPTMLPACLNDPHRFPQMLDGQTRHWENGLRNPGQVYNLYDEGPTSAICLSPHCLEAYRGWLREQYHDDLAALNREWESDYATWDEVNVLEPNSMESVREQTARERGLYARAYDRNHFAGVNFIRRVLGEQTAHARRFDPHARLGFEASGGYGMDIDELFENAGFWVPYDGLQTELVGSLKPRDFIYSFWIGYAKAAEPSIALTWRMMLSGANAVWWWMTPGRGQYHGLVGANDELYPSRREFVEQAILPLRRGLGDLLINLDRRHDGIALYHSVAAAYAAGIDPSSSFASGSAQSIGRLLGDCGYRWTFTTRRRLLAGDLEARGIRLLILPFIQALGEDEVVVMRDFVERGGTVLADLRPGVFSGRCRPLERGPADALFGVQRTGPGKAVRLDGEMDVNLSLMGMDGQTRSAHVPMVLHNDRADGHLQAATATPAATLSEQPLVLVNQLGKGQAILLNFGLDRYGPVHWYRMPGIRKSPRGASQRAFFAGLVAALGVEPEVRRDDGQDGELLATQTTTWTSGNLTLHAFLRDTEITRQRSFAMDRYPELYTPARFVLPQAGHVFDLRRGPLGMTDTIVVPQFREAYAEFVAVYPYDPGEPVASVSRTVAEGGDRVDIDIRMSNVPSDETALFSFHTRLTAPDGEWVDILPWSTQGQGGRAVTHFRFAHNDPVGKWRLTVREVTTGRASAVSIEKR